MSDHQPLRMHQARSIDAVDDAHEAGQMRVVLQAPTGAGKTRMAAEWIMRARRERQRVIFIAPAIILIDQTVDRLIEAGIPMHDIGVMQADHPLTNPFRPVQVASAQTLGRRQTPEFDLCVVDECFSGDVEVLTPGGWVRFDGLPEGCPVAQVEPETGALTFVVPTEYIKTAPASDTIRLVSDRLIDITLTSGHRMWRKGHDGQWGWCSAGDLPLAQYTKMAAGAMAAGPEKVLTPIEKLAIATQADGSIARTGADGKAVLVHFSFAKQRKIDAFLGLMQEGGWRFTEVQGKDKKGRRRWIVWVDAPFSKRVWEHFDLALLSHQKCRKIVEYCIIWDGHRSTKNSWLYSNACGRSADFYQAVAAMAGMRTYRSIARDDRDPNYSDIHRLFFCLSGEFSLGNVRREPASADHVYCVRVPTGALLVRSNGRTLVTGNCHNQFNSVLELLKSPANRRRRFIGLSATPWAPGMGKTWDKLIVGSTIETLTQDGWLKPIRYYAPMSIDTKGVRISAGDFNIGDLSKASNKRSILANTVQQWLERGENRPTIAYCVDRSHARAMQERFTEVGVPCEYIDANTPTDERKEIERRLERGESKVVASVGTLIAGVDWPFISCILHARKTKSHIFLIQTIGRGLRPHPDWKDCIVIDCAGNTDLGHPYDINFPELDDGKRSAAERRKRLKLEIALPRPCPACGHQRAQGERTCSACGHTPPLRQTIEEGNAKLGVFNKGGSVKQSAGKYDTPEWRQIWYSSLLAIQRDRGYKPGWVANQYREKYGEWPEKSLRQEAASYPDPVVASWVRSRLIRYARGKAKEGS